MNTFFYNIDTSIKLDCIRISPTTDYDPRYVLNKNTELKVKNNFIKSEGKKWYDTIPFLDAANFAISNKFKSVLEENNITGWSSFPICINNYEKEDYYAFQIISKRAGKILNLEKLNNYEDEYIKFDLESWDGSDIFTLEKTGITACTEKVKTIIEQNNLSNIEARLL